MCINVTTQSVLVLPLTACAAVSMGGCQPPTRDAWATIQITGLPDGVGEDVRVFADGGNFPDAEIESAPPRRDGLTHLPYWTWTNDVVHLRIVSAAQAIELDIALESGAVAERDGVSVRVIDADAPPPPVPAITVVPGSSPPVFMIDGYIRSFEVCDCNDGGEEWSVVTPTVIGAYIRSIEFGTIPAGWRVPGPYALLSHDGETLHFDCRRDISCGGRRRPMANPSFTNELIVGDAYCVDAEDTVVSCSKGSAAQAD